VIENLPGKLTRTLAHFGVTGSVGQITDGPLLTEVEFLLSEGSKFSFVEKLAKDIGRELGVTGVRVSEVPNSTYIRFEIPQDKPQTVPFAPLTYSADFIKAAYALPVCLGVDMRGNPVMKDLSKMPHLLVAGTTGSGKSVGLNSFIMSLIHKKQPEELQFVLIDPKRIEFSMYNNQKYMLRPVITDMSIASNCLGQLCAEMERRYGLFEKSQARNIGEYNKKVKPNLPYIVCIIDEFADLIMFDREVEKNVQTLAQKSRAAGIHLIIATQRPSVDVITGTLKANLPTRLSYKVASPADSMTILNTAGAEDLIGRGDSLFLEENGTLTRILGAYVSDEEIIDTLKPYHCEMPSQNEVAQLMAKGKAEEKQTAAAKQQSGKSFWSKVGDLWDRIGRRNQTRIINGIITFILTATGIKNSRRK